MNWAKTRWLGLALRIPVQSLLALSTQVPVYNGICSSTGVYNTSFTPANLPWNTYNYCNAPHVNAAHYEAPANAPNATLVYLNTIIRHHKRTPDNLYPEEGELNQKPWNCSHFLQFNHGGGTTHIFHETYSPPWHPFLIQFWNGTCDEGQLTYEGLQDTIRHGEDFWSVYAHKLGFLKNVNERDIFVRTSVADRTYQVAGGILTGMDRAMASKTFPVLTQPSAIDSIVPDYPCPNADSIRDAYQSVPAWDGHLEENADLQNWLCTTLGVSGNTAWTSWCKLRLAQSLETQNPWSRRLLLPDDINECHQMTTFSTRSARGLAMATLCHATPPAHALEWKMPLAYSRSGIGSTTTSGTRRKTQLLTRSLRLGCFSWSLRITSSCSAPAEKLTSLDSMSGMMAR